MLGIKPARTDKTILKAIMIPIIGRVSKAIFGIPNGETTALMIRQTIAVIPMPMRPLMIPVTKFSAMNKRETSFLRPPRERITPISLTLSMTEIYVITAIMKEETTSDKEVKTTKAVVIIVIIVLIAEMINEIVSL